MARRPRDPPDGPHRTKNRGPSGPVTVSEDVTSVSPPRRDRDGAGLPDQGLIDVKRTLTTPQKLAATLTVLATAGALTAGAFAGWASTASQHQDIGAAIVSSTLTTTNGDSPWADIDVTNFAAGDSYTVYGRLTNTGTVEQTFTLKVAGSNGHLTAPADGLQVMVMACTKEWVEGDCFWTPGSEVSFPIAQAFITDGGVSSSELITLAPGAASFLRVDFSLPENASDAFQGQLDRFLVTETGTSTGFTAAAPQS